MINIMLSGSGKRWSWCPYIHRHPKRRSLGNTVDAARSSVRIRE